TGEVGSGKTTLIRYMLEQMGEELRVGMITNTHASLGSLLQWVLASFDLSYKDAEKLELYDRFLDFLVTEYAEGRRVVLIVDEAQNMGPDMLEELRMLSNINADKHQILQTVLVGQPELRATLRHPAMRQFAQRIAVDYHLEPLDREDTAQYVYHRLQVAGAAEPIFSRDAIDEIYKVSKGVPRLINLICDTALVYAFGAQLDAISVELVKEVLDDKGRGGLVLRSAQQRPSIAAAAADPSGWSSPPASPAPSSPVSWSAATRSNLADLPGEEQSDDEARELFSSLRRSTD
ncbi:MAG: AAA family ATPase, partial [Pseudomonadota bacterium]